MQTRHRDKRRPSTIAPPPKRHGRGGDATASAATPTAKSSAPDSKKNRPPPSETPTVLPESGASPLDGDEEDDAHDPVLVHSTDEPAKPPVSPHPLRERVPTVASIIAGLKNLHTVKQIFKHSTFFRTEDQQSILWKSPLWEEVSELLIDAIIKFTPSSEKDLQKYSIAFELQKRDIQLNYICKYMLDAGGVDLEGGVDSEEDRRSFETAAVLGLVGHEFLRLFQRQISPARGADRVPIADQVESMVQESIALELDDYFDRYTGQCVYYVVGFFCNAGAKEAERRTDGTDVGKCIKSLSRHFAVGRDDEAMRAVKSDLPSGLSMLVDQRMSLGGLRYPDVDLFTVFALIERVYSSLITPQNFSMYGGVLMESITDEMGKNATIISMFSSLFDLDEFSEATIGSAMRYYLRVFGNTRAKDVCYRYNSNITKGDTVGLRQTLAAGGRSGGVKSEIKQEGAAGAGDAPISKKLTIVRLRVAGKLSRKRLAARLPIDVKQRMGLEPCPPPKDAPLAVDEEHGILLCAAGEDVDACESYEKLCTIDKEATEHMGKSITD